MVPRREAYDAVVVGAGPNGLAAAISLSKNVSSVLLVEAKETVGGGMRSAELTLPHFIHDVCSAVHPLGISSPFFRRLGLAQYGLSWIQPEIPVAHPFEDGTALALHRSLELTADLLGPDGKAYKELLTPLVDNHETLIPEILSPLHLPRRPFIMGLFSIRALRSAESLVNRKFRSPRTRALFSGLSAHAMIPLENAATAAFGLVLATLAHTAGFPIVKGGSQKLADALAAHFRARGGEILTGKTIEGRDGLPKAKYYFFDLTPRQLLNLAGLGLSERYRRKLERFRYGPGVYKMDWALTEPIPWKAEFADGPGPFISAVPSRKSPRSLRVPHTGEYFPFPFCRPRPAEPLRLLPRPRGEAYRVGLLPRPARLFGGYFRPHREEDRTIRPGVPRRHSGEERPLPGGHGTVQPQLRRGRHQRGRAGSFSTLHAAGSIRLSLPNVQ